MRSTAFSSALLALLAVARADSNSTTYPGRCTATKDCATYDSKLGLECIAVDSSTAGLAKLNMCIAKGTICSGSIPGRCPTFSSWPAAYRKVQTVCAFTVVNNCNKKIGVTAPIGSGDGSDEDVGAPSLTSSTSSSASADPSLVECYVRNFTVGDEYKVVNGIYQCMDARKYISTNGGHLTNLTESQILACGGNVSSSNPTLCSGQGTCSPKTAFAQEYECKCNSGYTGDKYCATASSNECSNLGQCGVSGTCSLQNSTSGVCVCKDGATGNQCAACDPSAKDVCSGKGTCSADGVCKCNSGYTGTQCADSTSSGGSGGSTSGAAVHMPSIKTFVATIALAAALGAMVFA